MAETADNSPLGPRNKSTPIQPWEQTEDYNTSAELMRNFTKARTKLTPKNAQVRFAMALLSGQDVTCVAATGFGKSLAYQMASMLMPGKFGLIVTPIIALGEDQVDACRKYRLRAINFTTEALDSNPHLLKQVSQGDYDLVFLSPEKFFDVRSPFPKLLNQGKSFVNRIGFLVCDECHLVVDWGKTFRTDFARLGVLRTRLPGVPFGACTATASPDKLQKIREGLGIDKKAISILEPTNRANLFYSVRAMEGTGLGDVDLDFLVPRTNGLAETAFDSLTIPKTIIYVDSKPLAPKIANAVRLLLPGVLRIRPERPTTWDGDPRSMAEKIVSVYHADVSATMRNMVIQDWRGGTARVMVATSAWGMGINDTGVERIIQWGVKHLDNLDTLVQRFGRCARDPNIQGLCMLFTEKIYIGARAQRKTVEKNADTARSRANMEERRAELDDAVYKFLNTPGSVKCRRRIMLGYFGDPDYHSEPGSLTTGPCCDSCGHDDNLTRLAPILASVFKVPAKPLHSFPRANASLQIDIKLALKSLRTRLFHEKFPHDDAATDSEIFSDQQLTKLVQNCRGIKTMEDLLHVPGLTFDRYFHTTFAEAVASTIRIGVQGHQETSARQTDSRVNPENTYALMKIPELKALLRTRSLPITGNKTELIQRILRNDSLRESHITQGDTDRVVFEDLTQDQDINSHANVVANTPQTTTWLSVNTQENFVMAPASKATTNKRNRGETPLSTPKRQRTARK